MNLRYHYALHEQAAQSLIEAEEADRRELLRFFERLAQNPGLEGDESVADAAGRRNEVAYSDHFRIVFWADHGAKEIRILDVRRY